MNAKRHKHADLIIAWAQGEEIEYRANPECEWELTKNPIWVNHFEYRIKPKKVKKEGWVNVYRSNSLGWTVCDAYVYSRKEAADLAREPKRVACIRIEWEEEE